MDSKQCSKLNSVAYNSCVYSYHNTKDKNDVFEYWLYLIGKNRICEANGVEKALEFISLLENLNVNG